MSELGVIREIWRYPVKSFGGESIAAAVLAQPGLPRDRAVRQALAAGNRTAFGDLGEVASFGVYAEVREPGPVAVGDAVVLGGRPD